MLIFKPLYVNQNSTQYNSKCKSKLNFQNKPIPQSISIVRKSFHDFFFLLSVIFLFFLAKLLSKTVTVYFFEIYCFNTK